MEENVRAYTIHIHTSIDVRKFLVHSTLYDIEGAMYQKFTHVDRCMYVYCVGSYILLHRRTNHKRRLTSSGY